MIVFHVLEVSSADQVVFPEMVQKVKVWTNISGHRTLTIVLCNVMYPSGIAELALLEVFWFGEEHPLIAEPALALGRQYHVEMLGRYMVYPAVDVVEAEGLLAIAIPKEFAREPLLSTWQYRRRRR